MEKSYSDMEQCLDLLYEYRAKALDTESTWNIRNDAWVAIDGLLDWYNELRNVGNDEDLNL